MSQWWSGHEAFQLGVRGAVRPWNNSVRLYQGAGRVIGQPGPSCGSYVESLCASE